MTAGHRLYRQIKQPDGTSKLVEILNPPPRISEDLRFEGNFISPVDGSLIRNKYDLVDHNKRNDVIQSLPGMDQDVAAIGQANRDAITGKQGKQERTEAIRAAIEQGERSA